MAGRGPRRWPASSRLEARLLYGLQCRKVCHLGRIREMIEAVACLDRMAQG